MATPFQDLDTRTTIEFPHLVGLPELGTIFNQVSRTAKCRFEYTTVIRESRGNGDLETGKLLPNEQYASEIKGRIQNSNGRAVTFICRLDINYDHPQGPQTRIAGLKFMTTPGYNSIEELAGRVFDDVGTMDVVRTEIGRYFGKSE